MGKNLTSSFTRGPVLRQLIVFSIPLILANILQSAYSMVDMIIVGHYVGAEGLSAVGISSQLLSMFTTVGMAVGTAGQVLISQQMGIEDYKGLNRTIGTIFSTELALAVVMGLCGILLSPLFLRLMNTPQEVYDQAYSYLIIGCSGMIFIYGYNAVSCILRGMGDSKLPLLFIAIAAVANTVFDILFVGPLQWGVAGAAAATVLGQAISFVCSIIYLYIKRKNFHFDFKLVSFKIEVRRLKTLLRLGVPMAVQFVAITVSMMYVNAQVNTYGVIASAVDGVGSKFSMLINVVSGAMSTAGAAMIGQNFAAGEHGRIKQIVRYSMLICMAFWAVGSALLLLFPTQVFSLFSNEPEVLGYAPLYMRICVIFFLSMATMAPPMAITEGVGNAKLGLIVGLLDGVVARIALCTILGHVMGLPGFWLGNALAGFVSTIINGVYYLGGRWKQRGLLSAGLG